jgi:hypothetical protein
MPKYHGLPIKHVFRTEVERLLSHLFGKEEKEKSQHLVMQPVNVIL